MEGGMGGVAVEEKLNLSTIKRKQGERGGRREEEEEEEEEKRE